MKIRLSKYDKQWSQLVRDRDRMCVVCGNPNIAAHHIFRRGIKATRLCLENGISLCASHHVFNHEFSAHKTPEAFRRWFKKNFSLRWEIINRKQKQHLSERDAIKEFELIYAR